LEVSVGLADELGIFFSIGVIVSAALIAAGGILFNRIVGEVNAKSPADQRISPLWANMRFGVVLHRHRKFFPQSKKRTMLCLALVAGLCALTTLLVTTAA
jgi:hypothetical protein